MYGPAHVMGGCYVWSIIIRYTHEGKLCQREKEQNTGGVPPTVDASLALALLEKNACVCVCVAWRDVPLR